MTLVPGDHLLLIPLSAVQVQMGRRTTPRVARPASPGVEAHPVVVSRLTAGTLAARGRLDRQDRATMLARMEAPDREGLRQTLDPTAPPDRVVRRQTPPLTGLPDRAVL